MKGDQVVELTLEEQMLSKAISVHMGNDNCCGMLIYACWISNNMDLTNKIYQFVCKKCHEVIQVK